MAQSTSTGNLLSLHYRCCRVRICSRARVVLLPPAISFDLVSNRFVTYSGEAVLLLLAQ